jgi:hypothetical protein
MGNNHLFWPYKKDSNRPDQGIQKKKKKYYRGQNTGERGGEQTGDNREEKPKTQKQRKTQKAKDETRGGHYKKNLEKKKKNTKRGGIPLSAFCCHPPSTFKSHHIGFRPVLQESPSSPLSPQTSRDFFSAPQQQHHPCPSLLAPFYEKYCSKASSC